MKNASYRILLVRTTTCGITPVAQQLKHHGGLDRSVDFQTFTDTNRVEEWVFESSTPQLLLIDSFCGEVAKSAEFVKELRQKNPRLVAVLIALRDENHPTFNRAVDYTKDDWGRELVQIIRDFRSGRLQQLNQKGVSVKVAWSATTLTGKSPAGLTLWGLSFFKIRKINLATKQITTPIERQGDLFCISRFNRQKLLSDYLLASNAFLAAWYSL